ncbi:hypothetical protein MiSe_91770 [Microseira wollei NIES-4236]|uniref:Uncharacterized protein n=1 Tax=Microseira wollei NIES-4236 TaxID=2530354 RepID=A0AAV3XT04_9CYAN|nr:hypothetical protein MiSe_91770 [Microseira wollei NIES-4236]
MVNWDKLFNPLAAIMPKSEDVSPTIPLPITEDKTNRFNKSLVPPGLKFAGNDSGLNTISCWFGDNGLPGNTLNLLTSFPLGANEYSELLGHQVGLTAGQRKPAEHNPALFSGRIATTIAISCD